MILSIKKTNSSAQFILSTVIFATTSLQADEVSMSDLKDYSRNYTTAYLNYIFQDSNTADQSNAEINGLKIQRNALETQRNQLLRELEQLSRSAPLGPSESDLQSIARERRNIRQNLMHIYQEIEQNELLRRYQLRVGPGDRPPGDHFGDDNDHRGDRDWDRDSKFERFRDNFRRSLERVHNDIKNQQTEIQRNLQRLTTEIRNLRQSPNYLSAERELHAAQMTLNQNRSKYDSLNRTTVALEQEFTNINTNLDQLSRQLLQIKNIILQKDTRINAIPLEITDLRSKIEKYNEANGVGKLQSQLAAAHGEKNKYHNLYEDLQRVIGAKLQPTATEQEANLLREYISKKEAAEQEIAKLDIIIFEHTHKMSQLKNQIVAKEAELTRLNREIAQSNSDLISVQKSIDLKSDRKSALPKLITDSRQALTQIDAQLKTSVRVVELAQSKITEIEHARIHPLERELLMTEKMDHNLRDEVERFRYVKSVIFERFEEISRARVEIQRILSRPQERRETPQMKALITQIDALDLNINSIDKQISELSKESPDLYKHLLDWEDYILGVVAGTIRD